MRKVLFIHIPKTSGTSLAQFFKTQLGDFFVQANAENHLEQGDPLVGRVKDLHDIRRVLAAHEGLALHVDSGCEQERMTTDFRSLAWHVFEPDNVEYFRQCAIVTMLRDPFRSFVSSYEFVKRTKALDAGFLPDLDLGSIESFLDQVHENAILHFLLEPQLSRRRAITRDDLERVKARIADYPIHVGIYERYPESLGYFARVIGRSFDMRDLPSSNVGSYGREVAPEVESAFRERNRLDLELYDYSARLLEERVRGMVR